MNVFTILYYLLLWLLPSSLLALIGHYLLWYSLFVIFVLIWCCFFFLFSKSCVFLHHVSFCMPCALCVSCVFMYTMCPFVYHVFFSIFFSFRFFLYHVSFVHHVSFCLLCKPCILLQEMCIYVHHVSFVHHVFFHPECIFVYHMYYCMPCIFLYTIIIMLVVCHASLWRYYGKLYKSY